MAAKKLDFKHKYFIVVKLAQCERPRDVARDVLEEFGITLSVPGVLCYDPTTSQGRFLSENLTNIFWNMRRDFIDPLEFNIPIACQAYRMTRLQEIVEANEHNPRLILRTLKLAAKDMGAFFVRSQRGPVRHSNPYVK